MTPLAKYIWLIEQLQKSVSGLTFEEINEEWLKFRRDTEDKNIPILKRTFFNHIKAIREEYGIHIECGTGYKYHIADPDKEVLPKLELLSALNMLSETVTDSKLSQNLHIDDYIDLFRNKILMTVMDAIKTKHKVKLANLKYHRIPKEYQGVKLTPGFLRKMAPKWCVDDKYRVLNVAPYQLHYISSQWYLIGETEEYGLMRIPLTYYKRIGGTCITDESYNYPANYNSEDYGKMIYGKANESIHLTINLAYNDEVYYFDQHPLSPFQENVDLTSPYVKISFTLPKSPFALYTLKRKLEKYSYKYFNDIDPFALFTEEQYNEAMSIPTIL